MVGFSCRRPSIADNVEPQENYSVLLRLFSSTFDIILSTMTLLYPDSGIVPATMKAEISRHHGNFA